MMETALLLAAGQAAHGARAGSPFVTKAFQRHRDRELGPFKTLKEKNAAEAVAVEKVAKLQSELLAASSRKALVVASTTLDPHLRSFAVKPLACVAEKASTPEEAVTRLKLDCEVFDACTKNCLRWRGACTCKGREWRSVGKLLKMFNNGEKVLELFFDGRKKPLKLTISLINERLKPASGNGDGLSLLRKAARAAARAGWNAPPELASVTRAQSG